MLQLQRLAVWLLLALCGLTAFAAPVSAAEYETAAACSDAFKFTDAFPAQRVVLVPSQPREHTPATVCILDFVYVTHVDVAQGHQHLTVTLYDNGFSWSPNPPIIVSGDLPSLPAGTYTMDVVVTAGFADPPSYYPYNVAGNIPIVVAGGGGGQVASTPMLNGWGIMLVILTLASAALRRMRAAKSAPDFSMSHSFAERRSSEAPPPRRR